MKDVNLLPTDLLKKTGTKKLGSDIQNLAVAGFAIFLLAVVASFGYIIILSVQTKNLKTKQDNLEASVRTLEKTEQEIVLVKDRLGKTENILLSDDAYKEIVNFDETILSYLPPGITVSETKVSEEYIEISYTVTSSALLVNLFENVLNPEVFSKVELDSLSFSPSIGYILRLKIFNL